MGRLRSPYDPFLYIILMSAEKIKTFDDHLRLFPAFGMQFWA